MKTLVFAYHNVGYVCLKELISKKENIVAVITHHDDKNEKIWFNSVYDLARRHGIPTFRPRKEYVKTPDFKKLIEELAPEIIFSFYYRYIIPEGILIIPPRGAINLHGSLLPKYRGRCPVNWVLMKGEKKTGVTLHYMEKTADSGDIIDQENISISQKDDAYTLFKKITDSSLKLFRHAWPSIKRGKNKRKPQNHKRASYFGGRKPEDGRIHWSNSARDIQNLIRGITHPYPGAFTTIDGRIIFVWESTVPSATEPASKLPPGLIIKVYKRMGLLAAASKGNILLKKIQYQGEKELKSDLIYKRCISLKGKLLGT